MRVVPYAQEHKPLWDAWVRRSTNATFLFHRDYLEYHGARLDDRSLLVFDDDELAAVLPGHRDGDCYVSHGGMTYGGFAVDDTVKLPAVLEMFDAVAAYLVADGFTSWVYKTVPSIYHRIPAEEDRYALFLLNAELVRRAMLTVVNPQSRPQPQERRLRRVKRARAAGAVVRESSDYEQYWPILTARLLQAFNVPPVHSLEEITLLQRRFPGNIRLFAAFEAETMTAGVVVYESERVARTQYIVAGDQGRNSGSLDLLLWTLIGEVFADKPYVEFGTSDEEQGRRLNQGLIEFKEGFGGRSVAHDHYRIDLKRPVRCVQALSTRRSTDA